MLPPNEGFYSTDRLTKYIMGTAKIGPILIASPLDRTGGIVSTVKRISMGKE